MIYNCGPVYGLRESYPTPTLLFCPTSRHFDALMVSQLRKPLAQKHNTTLARYLITKQLLKTWLFWVDS